jgi:hypothetical protein
MRSAALVLALAAGAAHAVPVTYTVAGVGTGIVASQAFTNKAYRLEIHADTDELVRTWLPVHSMTLVVDGVGASPMYIGGLLQLIFFGGAVEVEDTVFGDNYVAFGASGVDLGGWFDPVPGDLREMDLGLWSDDNGKTIMLRQSSDVVFTTSIPEPSTWALMFIGVAALSRRWRGKP